MLKSSNFKLNSMSTPANGEFTMALFCPNHHCFRLSHFLLHYMALQKARLFHGHILYFLHSSYFCSCYCNGLLFLYHLDQNDYHHHHLLLCEGRGNLGYLYNIATAGHDNSYPEADQIYFRLGNQHLHIDDNHMGSLFWFFSLFQIVKLQSHLHQQILLFSVPILRHPLTHLSMPVILFDIQQDLLAHNLSLSNNSSFCTASFYYSLVHLHYDIYFYILSTCNSAISTGDDSFLDNISQHEPNFLSRSFLHFILSVVQGFFHQPQLNFGLPPMVFILLSIIADETIDTLLFLSHLIHLNHCQSTCIFFLYFYFIINHRLDLMHRQWFSQQESQLAFSSCLIQFFQKSLLKRLQSYLFILYPNLLTQFTNLLVDTLISFGKPRILVVASLCS